MLLARDSFVANNQADNKHMAASHQEDPIHARKPYPDDVEKSQNHEKDVKHCVQIKILFH